MRKRNRRHPAIWAALAVLTLPAALARADAVPAPPRIGGEAEAREAVPDEPTPALAGWPSWITLGGFVDTSLFVPLEESPDVLIGLDQVELDVEARPAAGLRLRTDLNVFPAAAGFSADSLLEQGFVEYFFGGGDEGFFLTAGKRNAPIGVESVDPIDMYQFSHGLLFSFATPTNLTGFFTGWTGHGLTVMAWATNDWDTPTTADSASAGGRVAYDFGRGTVGLSGTYGPFAAGEPLTMLDLDVAVTLGDLYLFLEGNWGREAGENSFGALVKAHYAFTDRLGGTLRWDWLDRPFDGLDDRSSATAAFLFAFNEHLAGVVEVRADMAAFEEPDWTGAVELTAKF